MIQDELTPWKDLYPQFLNNPLSGISSILSYIQIIPSEQDAAFADFNRDYQDAMCMYNDLSEIAAIIAAIGLDHKKYTLAFDYFKATKVETREREPDLTTTTHGSSNGTAEVERKQTATQTETPTNYGSDRTHYVNPYDNPGITIESKDELRETGTRSVSTSYTGQPDKTTTRSSGNTSTSETGTDTTTITTIGSDGRSLADQIEGLEASKTVWSMIKCDIAKKLFLQVWR